MTETTSEAESGSDTALRRAGWRLLREPALVLSLAYLATSALGLWASYWLYRPFGIPIFEYMQPSDMLVAGLRDPTYLLLVLASLGLLVLMRLWERWRFDHPERVEWLRRHWWGRLWAPRWRERLRGHALGRLLFGAGFLIYIALILVLLYTRDEAERLHRGEGLRLQLVYAGATAPTGEPALLIGTTAGWVFVYWPQQQRAEAIAQQSLRSLTYPPIVSPAAR